MTYNQWQKYEGEIQHEELTIHYIVMWVRDVPRDTVQLDEIEDAWVLDSDCEVVEGYYQEHRAELDELILEDAYKHEPSNWETPSWSDIQEARAEQERD